MTQITINIQEGESLDSIWETVKYQYELLNPKNDPGFHTDQDMIDFAKWCCINNLRLAQITTHTIEKWHDHLADDFVQV